MLVNVLMVAPSSKHFDVRKLVSSWADVSLFDIVHIVCVHCVDDLNPPFASNTTGSVHSSTRTPGSSILDLAAHKRLTGDLPSGAWNPPRDRECCTSQLSGDTRTCHVSTTTRGEVAFNVWLGQYIPESPKH